MKPPGEASAFAASSFRSFSRPIRPLRWPATSLHGRLSYLSCTARANAAGSLTAVQPAQSAATTSAKAKPLARATLRSPWSGIGRRCRRRSGRRAELDRRTARQERLAARIRAAGVRGPERTIRQRLLLLRFVRLRLELFVGLIELRHGERARVVP